MRTSMNGLHVLIQLLLWSDTGLIVSPELIENTNQPLRGKEKGYDKQIDCREGHEEKGMTED